MVRTAQCIIPDSRKAEELLEEQLKKFGKNTWLESRKNDNDTRKAKSSIDEGHYECVEVFTTVVCTRNSETGELENCMITNIQCLKYIYVYDEDPNGGSGGGGGEPSSGPGDCDPNAGPPYIPCEDDGNGGSAPIPEPDPCEEANPPAWCSNKCETGDAIIDNTGVQEKNEDIYESGNVDAPDQNDRLEQGFYVTQDPISGELSSIDFPSDWQRLPCEILFGNNFPVPENTVAIVHLHPFQLNDLMYGCHGISETVALQYQQINSDVIQTYLGNPSPGDTSLIRQINDVSSFPIKAYLIDKDGITEYDKDSDPEDLTTSTRHERCGF